MQPHRWQPTRLPHPWDSPGKSTGVGGHCLLRPSYVVSANYRVLICCTCHFQSSSLFILASSVCWSLQCLISSLTQGAKVVTYLGLLAQSFCGEGETLQTNITGMCGKCSQCLSHIGFVPAHSLCDFPVYTVQALGCSAGNYLSHTLGCVNFPGLSHSASGSRVLHRGADLVWPAFCAFPRSKQLR